MVLRIDLHMYGYQAATCGLSTYIRHPKPIKTVVIFNISMQERLFLYLGVVRWNRALIATNATVLVKEKKGLAPPASSACNLCPGGVSGFSAVTGCM
jgi:hypothetical protein